MPISIAVYDSHTDNDPSQLPPVPWSQIVRLLERDTPSPCTTVDCAGKACPHKYGRAWSPVIIDGTRSNENVKAVTLAVFDLDGTTAEQLRAMSVTLNGLSFVIHSTHSHRANATHLRLVIELACPVPAAEFPRVHAAIIARYQIPSDPQCKDISRLYFLPTRPSDVPRQFVSVRGSPLDIATLPALPSLPQGAASTPLIDLEPATRPVSASVDLGKIREVLESAYRSKAHNRHVDMAKRAEIHEGAYALRRMLDGEQIAEPGARDGTLNKLMAMVAFAAPAGTTFDDVAEIVRPGLAKMASSEGIAHWLDEAADMFARASERRRVADAEQARVRKNIIAASEGLFDHPTKERAHAAPVDGRVAATGHELSAASDSPIVLGDDDSEDAEDDLAWLALLKRSDKDVPLSNGYNANIILRHDAGVRGCIRWNDLTRAIEVIGGKFAAYDDAVVVTRITNWLCAKYSLSLPSAEVGRQMLEVARGHKYDPLGDMLQGLVWDGVERIDTWLVDYIGAETTNGNGVDVSALVNAFGWKFLVSAVARGLEPGCKVDTVLIFEGLQGLRKSQVFDVLGHPWFTDDTITMGDKDSKMLTSKSWLIELAELASFRRGDIETQRGFLSQRADKFRPPYGSVIETFHRRCVFVGTVNPRVDGGGYLIDETGNRRFWPVLCTKDIDVERLRRDRDQLWAEAVVRYRAFCDARDAGTAPKDNPHRWWFERGEQAVIEADVMASRVDLGSDVMAGAVTAWWHSVQRKPEFVVLYQAAQGINMDPARINPAQEQMLGRALKRAGFERARRQINGQRVTVYLAPAGRSTALTLVPDATVNTEDKTNGSP